MFLGIDPSLSGSGLVVIDDNYVIISTKKFSTPVKGVERLYHLELKLLEFLDEHKDIKLVCVEGPALREVGRIFDLGQWAGLLYLTLFKKGISFISVAPLQLKKYVSLSGKNRGKDVVILDVYKNFGEEIRDSDIADAYVLSRIAHDYYGVFVENKCFNFKKARNEVLQKLHKSRLETQQEGLL